MPNLIGGIVLAYVWKEILNDVIQKLYGSALMLNPNYGFWGLVILLSWQQIGYMMIIYIAGLQNVSTDLVEAAKMDGASSWQILRKITIPQIMPSVTICLFLSLTNAFKLFDQNLALTAGAPNKKTEMLALNIYNAFYSNATNLGIGQAKAVIFFLLVVLISLTQLSLTRKKEAQL
jgi:raffinose/stachyose/melibiose transport system permease protein